MSLKVEDIVGHSGVPGMKWGVRRSSSALGAAKKAREKEGKDGGSSGSKPKSSRKEAKAARKEAKKAQSKAEGSKDDIKRDDDKTRFKTSSKKLTNDELNTRIKRMDTEKRYNELNKRNVSTGEKMAVDIMKHVGTETAKKVLTGAAAFGVAVAVERNFGKDIQKGILPKIKVPKKNK